MSNTESNGEFLADVRTADHVHIFKCPDGFSVSALTVGTLLDALASVPRNTPLVVDAGAFNKHGQGPVTSLFFGHGKLVIVPDCEEEI